MRVLAPPGAGVWREPSRQGAAVSSRVFHRGGLLTGTTLMWQCHGSRFDVTTGVMINGPATEPLNLYVVQEVDGDVQVRAWGTPRAAASRRRSQSVNRATSLPRIAYASGSSARRCTRARSAMSRRSSIV